MAAAMKHMALNFSMLEKFKGVDFKRWQKKMHLLLSIMSVVYVLTTPMPEDRGDNPTVEQDVETFKELWDTLKAKYMAKDASSKKFFVSNFINYKMTDSRPVLEQYNELLGILGRFTQHKMNMDESIQVSCIIDKLPPSWKDFKHTLKHLKEELTLIELGSHLRIEESLQVQDNDKPKGNNVADPLVINMVEHNNSSRYNDNKGKRKHHDTIADPNKKPKVTCWKCRKPGHLKRDYKAGNVGNKANRSGTKGLVDGSSNPLKAFMSTSELNDSIIWHARLGHVHFKRMQDMSKDGLIPAFDMDTEKCKTCMLTKITKKPFQIVKCETEVLELIHDDLCDLHAIPSLGNKNYFVTFINDALRFCYVYLLHSKDEALDKFKVFKTEVQLQQRSLIKTFRTDRGGEYMDTLYFQSVGIIHETTAPFTPQQNGISKRKNRHSKASRFYVIEPNDSVAINSIIESRDAMFDENRFLSVPRPSQRSLVNGTENSNGSVVPKKVIDEDGVSYQHSYCFNVEDDPKTFDEAMKSQDYHKNADCYGINSDFLNGELDEEVYINQPQGFIMPGNENKEFFSSRFSMKDMGKADVILGIRIKHESNGIAISQSHYIEKAVSQLEYSRVIGCLMYAMTYTRHDIAFVVGKLSRYTSNPVLEGYTDASWISNTKNNSSTSGWVFLLSGGAISWASKKQTCITGSIMESEFVALAATSKEAEWLKNLLLEILL
ncbi:zinc finger, CCHC-type containing protein [Tanacetum coccineum]